MFNSLKYVKMFQKIGVSREQAETGIEIMTDILEKNLATKQDIKDLTAATKQEIKDLAAATKRDINELATATKQDVGELRQEFKGLTLLLEKEFKLVRSEMKQIEYRMTIKLGSVVTIVAGLAAAFLKYA